MISICSDPNYCHASADFEGKKKDTRKLLVGLQYPNSHRLTHGKAGLAVSGLETPGSVG